MSSIEIKIFSDAGKLWFGALKEAFEKAIATGIRLAAKELLKDCRPYVSMLTGRLRDSGRVEELENYAFKLVWDAANPKSGYIYAAYQHNKILQHVDGKYAAKWVSRTLEVNKGRYVMLANRLIEAELSRVLGVES
ncbi:MAG: hypothetical protein V2A69_15970 [Pseudomonadota bacterium]